MNKVAEKEYRVQGTCMPISHTTIGEMWECWFDINTGVNCLRFGSVQYTMNAKETFAALQAVMVAEGVDINDIEGVHFPKILFTAMIMFGRRAIRSSFISSIEAYNEKYKTSLPTTTT